MTGDGVADQRIFLAIIGGLIGAGIFVALGEWIRPTASSKVAAPSHATQSAAPADVIVQSGAAVGKVFGGRRSPIDATVFEFQEITQAGQFNIDAEFEYQGLIFKAMDIKSVTGLKSSRPQDGRIIEGMIAKVVRQK